MNISIEELTSMGFRRAGTVYPDATAVVQVQVDWNLEGYAVYAMRVGHEIKKFGTTGRKNSSFKVRMGSTFSALRQTIRGGTPYLGDPFKRFGPAAVLDNREIELWLKPSTKEEFEIEESRLNIQYRPEWTKEGH
jgi:hypothetical protein